MVVMAVGRGRVRVSSMLNQKWHTVFVDGNTTATRQLQGLEGVSDGSRRLLWNWGNKRSQGLLLTGHAPPTLILWTDLLKHRFKESILGAEFVCGAISETVTPFRKTELGLVDGCHVDLDLLKGFALSEVNSHALSSNLRQFCSHCVAQIDQIGIVQYLRAWIVKVLRFKIPFVFALFHKIAPLLCSILIFFWIWLQA